MLSPVVQEGNTGCGIACVAALARVGYQEAKETANAVGIYAPDRSLWSDTDYVRRLLSRYGIRAEENERPFESWETLPDLALLAITWRMKKEKAFWRWVVFQRLVHDALFLTLEQINFETPHSARPAKMNFAYAS